MTTITKEQLIAHIERRQKFARCGCRLSDSDRVLDAAVLEIALASLEAEPIGAFHIADQQVDGTSDYIKDGEWPIDNGVIEVYAAPPAPDDLAKAFISAIEKEQDRLFGEDYLMDSKDCIDVIREEMERLNACRGTMNHGAAGNFPVIPDGWVDCSERLPEEGGRYWCYVEEINSLGKSHYQWNCSWNGNVWSDPALSGRVTHWMPLPAAPQQEVIV
ncbi:DUF551 domain-containing protein [Citrobacter braakii]|uniref:DUF551 domain-containing protein n=1 Tax=Citrobacter braakii TaxID=57706 RepID=UPI003974BCF3